MRFAMYAYELFIYLIKEVYHIMNDTISAIIIIASIVLSIGLILAEIYVFMVILTKKVLIPYKRHTADLSMPELLTALNAVIENQIAIYEKSIFEGGSKSIASNTQFDNYYKDLCQRIVDDLAPEFFDRMSFFMKKEAVIALICRTVKTYLADHVIR